MAVSSTLLLNYIVTLSIYATNKQNMVFSLFVSEHLAEFKSVPVFARLISKKETSHIICNRKGDGSEESQKV